MQSAVLRWKGAWMKYCPINDCNGEKPAICCADCPEEKCPERCRREHTSCPLWVEGQERMEKDRW